MNLFPLQVTESVAELLVPLAAVQAEWVEAPKQVVAASPRAACVDRDASAFFLQLQFILFLLTLSSVTFMANPHLCYLCYFPEL